MSALAMLLALGFSFSWAVAAVDPETGVILLGVVSSVLTLPFFVQLFGSRIVSNFLVSIFLMLLGALCPLLLPLVAIWAVLCLAGKLRRFVYSLPLVALGVLMYAATAHVPPLLLGFLQANLSGLPTEHLSVLVGLIGGILFLLTVRASVVMGSAPSRSASLLLGFGVYLILFLLTFLIPHADGGDS